MTTPMKKESQKHLIILDGFLLPVLFWALLACSLVFPFSYSNAGDGVNSNTITSGTTTTTSTGTSTSTTVTNSDNSETTTTTTPITTTSVETTVTQTNVGNVVENPNFTNQLAFPCTKGSLIMFNSYLYHGFGKNNTDHKRVSLAFNILANLSDRDHYKLKFKKEERFFNNETAEYDVQGTNSDSTIARKMSK